MDVDTGRSARAPVILDFDRDGHNDILLSNEDGAFARVRGLGNRGFAGRESVPQWPTPSTAWKLSESEIAFLDVAEHLNRRNLDPARDDGSHAMLAPTSQLVLFQPEPGVVAAATDTKSATERIYRFTSDWTMKLVAERSAWPRHERILSFDTKRDQHEELYAIDDSGNIARMPTTDTTPPCRISAQRPLNRMWVGATLAHLNDDDIPDIVASTPTSHLILYGVR